MPDNASPEEDFCDAAEVRESGIHGRGVFALRDLPKGYRIGLYTGRRYAADETLADHDNGLTYFFGLSDGTTIDGREGGNTTRFINHACNPNCAAYEETDASGVLQIMIETRRRVRRGEELFIDYSLDAEAAEPSEYACHCGSPRCRGTMLAPKPAPKAART